MPARQRAGNEKPAHPPVVIVMPLTDQSGCAGGFIGSRARQDEGDNGNRRTQLEPGGAGTRVIPPILVKFLDEKAWGVRAGQDFSGFS